MDDASSFPKWAWYYVKPMYRFNPMPEGALHEAIEQARRLEIQDELIDHDWPSRYWEICNEYAE
jgi:hypothetical protein